MWMWWTVRQLKSQSASKRLKAVEKLAAAPDEHTFVHLVTALSDSDFEVRVTAAQTLGQIGEARAVEPLVTALKDKFGSVREAAVKALDKIGDRQVSEELVAALKDEDSGVRESAVKALGKMREPRIVNTLVIALKDKDGKVRKAAADVLERTGAPESKQALEEYRRSEEEARRLAQAEEARRLAEIEEARRLYIETEEELERENRKRKEKLVHASVPVSPTGCINHPGVDVLDVCKSCRRLLCAECLGPPIKSEGSTIYYCKDDTCQKANKARLEQAYGAAITRGVIAFFVGTVIGIACTSDKSGALTYEDLARSLGYGTAAFFIVFRKPK